MSHRPKQPQCLTMHAETVLHADFTEMHSKSTNKQKRKVHSKVGQTPRRTAPVAPAGSPQDLYDPRED